jgi:hypothetical protein
VAPLVRALAPTDITELISREPSLEELFLSHYGDGARDAGADGASTTMFDGAPDGAG